LRSAAVTGHGIRKWRPALAWPLRRAEGACAGRVGDPAYLHPGRPAGLHLVSAWAAANRLTLGQVAVPNGSNEVAAIPELLKVLDLSGAVVTIDAAGGQAANAR
jgi:hypothetical protein